MVLSLSNIFKLSGRNPQNPSTARPAKSPHARQQQVPSSLPDAAAKAKKLGGSCSDHVRPFGGAGTWVELKADEINDQLHYHTSIGYQPPQCKSLQALFEGKKAGANKYYRAPAMARLDTPWTSRLVWTNKAGVPHRPFDAAAFLSRFRNSSVVLVGDSHCGILHLSLSLLVACSMPERNLWVGNPGVRLAVPELNITIHRQGANVLTPVIKKERDASAPSYYIKDGQRVPMRAQASTQVLRLDVPGLGEWANASQFRNAGLVIMKSGEWARNYRSDVKVITAKRGELGENATQEDFIKEVFSTGVSRAMAWFDEILPSTAVVVWVGSVTFGSKKGNSCSRILVGEKCKGVDGSTLDVELIKALKKRPDHWKGCRGSLSECARKKPRMWLLDINRPSQCRPDFQKLCFRGGENRTDFDMHPNYPGMPDLWNAMLLDSVLEDDVRCARPSALNSRTAPGGAYFAALEREERAASRHAPPGLRPASGHGWW